jgi:hypothetical protein
MYSVVPIGARNLSCAWPAEKREIPRSARNDKCICFCGLLRDSLRIGHQSTLPTIIKLFVSANHAKIEIRTCLLIEFESPGVKA